MKLLNKEVLYCSKCSFCFEMYLSVVFQKLFLSIFLQFWLDPAKTLTEHKELINSMYILVFIDMSFGNTSSDWGRGGSVGKERAF